MRHAACRVYNRYTVYTSLYIAIHRYTYTALYSVYIIHRYTLPLWNQLVRAYDVTAQLRVVPVGWRRLDLPSSPTGTSKRSISELHFHARRGVEIEISLMLNSCALHDSRIGCALLGQLFHASPRSADRSPPSLLLPMTHACTIYASSLARSLLISLAQECVPARSSSTNRPSW